MEPVMPQKVYSCAEDEDYASPEDEEMRYPGIKFSEEFAVYQTFDDTDLDEISRPLPEGVKPVLGLAPPPHPQEADENGVDKDSGDYEGDGVNNPGTPGNIPQYLPKRFRCSPSLKGKISTTCRLYHIDGGNKSPFVVTRDEAIS